MNRILGKLAAPLLSLVLVGGLYAQMRSYAVQDDTRPFHAEVKAAIEQVPTIWGSWEGTEVKPPEAAGQLLRPNAMLSRSYREASTGRWARLIIIHCRDSRDMGGHYPPNCYRGSGWTQRDKPTIFEGEFWGRPVPIAEYRFTRTELNAAIDWTIYDFFVLPSGRLVTSMDEIYAASSDYRARPYGAAQIQVIVDSSLPEAERRAILAEMLSPLDQVMKKLQAPRQGATP